MTRALSLLIGITLLSATACQKAPRNNAPESIDAYMASLSARAVDRARSAYGMSLDYSSESVKGVEKILAAKYDLQKTQPMSENEIADTAHLWGAYIGEVMKRTHPAHWMRDFAALAKDALPIVFNSRARNPFPVRGSTVG